MPPKVLHCNVREWIKSVEEEIAGKEAVPTPLSDAIGNLCLDHRILHRHGVGVTILFPVDHEYRMSLYNDSLSSDDDVYTNTVRRISALIMPERVTAISGLARNESKGDFALGSRNGYKYVFTPDGSNAKLSILGKDDKPVDTGCTVAPLKTSCRFSEIAYASAFALTVPKSKGEKSGFYKLPYEYLEKRQYQMKPAARTAVTGGSAEHPTEVYPHSNQYLGRRVELAKLLEFKYAACCASNKKESPYLITVVSLLNYLRANQPEIYADLLPILDVDPFISFYILVEPYRQSGHMLSDTVLYETGGVWEKMCLSKDPKTEYIGHLNNVKASSRLDITSQLTSLREEVIEELTYQGLISKVRSAYNAFVSSGIVNGTKLVKTSSLLTVERKIWQDEFRMHFSNSLQYVCSGKFSQPRYDEVIRSIQYCWPANDYAGEVILNRQLIDPKTSLVSRAELTMLRDFIYSTDFLYVCPTTATIGHEVQRQYDDKKDYTVFNRNYHAFARLESMTCDHCASFDSATAEISKTLASL